jgi:hypothetical protein
MKFSTMSNEELALALSAARTAAAALFAMTEPTIAQVEEAEGHVATIAAIEAEQGVRAAAVKDAAARFVAARKTFNAEPEVDETDETGETDTEEADEADEVEGSEASDADNATAAEGDAGVDAAACTHGPDGSCATCAPAKKQAASTRIKVSAAQRVGAKVRRPNVAPKPVTTITAAADIPGFATGSTMDDMEQVTKALLSRVKGFGKFNAAAGRKAFEQSNGEPVFSKYGVASFGIPFDSTLVASASGGPNGDYVAIRNAIKQDRHSAAVLTAGGWCAPSENVYSYLADYVVDGLITIPEVSATRGGLNITTGPAHVTQGTALDDFGWTQTEAQAIASTVKPFESIECPTFVDHRLDAVGYAYKIPLLTQNSYPELVTDALRLASVLYAHRTNRRIIGDLVNLSTEVTYSGYGASFTDALEALAMIATAERRKWNLGENAIMEVKLPTYVEEVFRADMSRRNGIARDSVSDAQIAAHFTDRGLAVQYVSDWQEIGVVAGALILPGTFKAMIYPSGTFIKAVEDVINLSAIYDAASLTVNEYTGVFFEQGILTAKAGYGGSVITVPINTAGEQGALIMTGKGDHSAQGSF